ncbi:MAG: hypothetical protein K6G65_06335 [Lachnospiraceae bacterium]|nr:hypothetical protein [Lachnospiraceae bacterium]
MSEELEKIMMEDAKKKAAKIVAEAEECAREIYGSSLQYVDDMLSEVSIIAQRAKESMRKECEDMLELMQIRIDTIEQNRQELLEQLQQVTENNEKPLHKERPQIKVDESYGARRKAYEVKIQDGAETKVEAHKPAKASYEIKIADEWKDRVEAMMNEANEPYIPEPEPEPEPEEDDGNFKSSDFDLDGEYFAWLDENEEVKQ